MKTFFNSILVLLLLPLVARADVLQVKPGESLKAVLSGAPATTNPTYIARTSRGVQRTGSFNGATPVTLASAPTLENDEVVSVQIYNVDTAAVTITFTLDTTVDVTLAKVTLASGDIFRWDQHGMRGIDSSAQAKQSDVSVLTVTPGTVAASKAVVVDSNKDITAFRHLTSTGTVTLAEATQSGARLLTGGAATAVIVDRFGKTATEGMEVRVIDEDVTLTNAAATALTAAIPAGAVILSAQINLDAAVVGDESGDDGLVKVGLGVTGTDPDKYGLTANLNKNTKTSIMPDWAVLGGSTQLSVNAVDTSGDVCTEKFTAGSVVRVQVVYLALNALDDAP